MERLARLSLVFAVAFAALFIPRAFLTQPFAPLPLMQFGDVVDILTPLILIPLYWMLAHIKRDIPPAWSESLIFLVLAALWTEGQGMHLAANSIGHLLGDMKASDVYQLTYFYDETLSHILWHLGVIGLSALLLWRQWHQPFAGQRSSLWLEGLAGLVYGLSYFMINIEGRTALFAVPYAVGVVVFGLVWGRNKLREQPLLAFFLVAHLLAIILFAYWGIRWGGLPEFSEVGIID